MNFTFEYTYYFEPGDSVLTGYISASNYPEARLNAETSLLCYPGSRVISVDIVVDRDMDEFFADCTLHGCGISLYTLRILYCNGIFNAIEALYLSDLELLEFPQLGPKRLKEIKSCIYHVCHFTNRSISYD